MACSWLARIFRPAKCRYVRSFHAALKFSEERYPQSGIAKISDATIASSDQVIQHAVSCLTSDFLGSLAQLRHPKGRIWAFGTQCANVHVYVLDALRRKWPEETFNLTLGGVHSSNGEGFPYECSDFEDDLKKRPQKIRGHVWITFNDSLIIDLTLGTYLVNIDPAQSGFKYGVVVSGSPGRLAVDQFTAGCALFNGDLTYKPVAVGTEAILAVSPSAADWQNS